jgi:predicted negative regulator of RcsB-dependent stress response
MADKEDIDVSKPAEPPKAQRIGGESIADRILPHIKKIIVAVIGIAVVASVYFGWRAYKESQQAEATERLAAVLALAQRPVAPPDTKPDPNNPTFASMKERAGALLDEMAKRDTDATGHAYRGGLLLDAGKVDDAIAEYNKGADKEGVEGVLSREGLGIALEEKARAEKDPAARQRVLEEALAAFAKMQPDPKGLRYHYALYHQGRVLQTLGKIADAKAKFEEAKTEAAPDLAVLVEQRLASLGAS